MHNLDFTPGKSSLRVSTLWLGAGTEFHPRELNKKNPTPQGAYQKPILSFTTFFHSRNQSVWCCALCAGLVNHLTRSKVGAYQNTNFIKTIFIKTLAAHPTDGTFPLRYQLVLHRQVFPIEYQFVVAEVRAFPTLFYLRPSPFFTVQNFKGVNSIQVCRTLRRSPRLWPRYTLRQKL